jgi:hypothetical protein
LFAIYLRRAEESVLGSVLVETTVLYMSTRHNPAQVLHEAAAAYNVDTEAIALKVKQEFAAKAKPQVAKKGCRQSATQSREEGEGCLAFIPRFDGACKPAGSILCARPSRPGRRSCVAGAAMPSHPTPCE